MLAAVAAFTVTLRAAGLHAGPPANLLPAPLSTPAPSATPLPLPLVAQQWLPSVVTIEVQTDKGEDFGTGWLLDRRGDFVTNNHVVEGRRTVRILDRRNRSHAAAVVGVDPTQDVAVVRSLDGFDGTPMVPGPSTDPPVEHDVVVLASSRATDHGDRTVEKVARLHQSIPVSPNSDVGVDAGGPSVYPDMIVLSGNQIYRGNSGGPVLDEYGRVIGIVTLASQATPQAFAIPLPRVLDELLALAARDQPQG